MAYALLYDRVEARLYNERLIAATLAAAGGRGDIPDADQALAEFEAALAAEPKIVDTEQDHMLRGLGLRGR